MTMEEAMTVRMRHGTRTGSDVLLYKNLKDVHCLEGVGVWSEWGEAGERFHAQGERCE